MTMPRKWPRGYYVYMFCYPDGTPYYVGMGKGNRIAHKNRNVWVQRITNKIETSGENRIVTLSLCENREEAVLKERFLIAQYGRRDNGTGILVNLTDGGDGGSSTIWTPEKRKLLSDKLRGRPCPETTKEAVRKAMLGNKHLLGHKHSEETRAKIGLASIRSYANLSEAKKENLRKLRSDNMLKRTPEERFKLSQRAGKSRNLSSEEMSRRAKLRKMVNDASD